MKIMLVEDEPRVRKSLEYMIVTGRSNDRLTASLRDGVAALQALAEHEPDLLVTDIAMPEMNGLELIVQAKTLYPQLEIVIVSGYDDFQYARRALQLGVQDYVLKPVRKEEFVGVLAAVEARLIRRAAASVFGISPDWALRRDWVRTEDKFVLMLENRNVEQALARVREVLDDCGSRMGDWREGLKTVNPLIYSMGKVSGEAGIAMREAQREMAGIDRLWIEGQPDVAAVYSWFDELLQRFARKHGASAERSEPIAFAAKQFVDKQFRQDINLQKIAEQLHVNASYLGQRFREQFGEPLNQYLNRIRIEHAARLLQQSSIRAYEAAELSGFQDAKHFTKTFKRIVGCTPQEYRERSAPKETGR